VLCSGSLRIATWDCDTNPPDEFRDEVLDWVCGTLTAAITEPAAQPEQSLCGHCGRQVIGDAWPIKPAAQPEPEARCKYCDGTGDVTSITGEWRGTCNGRTCTHRRGRLISP
jgi:hypothetical protein